MFRNDQNSHSPSIATPDGQNATAPDARASAPGAGATVNADAFNEEVRGILAARIGGFPAADLLMEDKGGVGQLVRTAQRHGGTPHQAADMIVDAVASQIVHQKLEQRATIKKMTEDGGGDADSFEAFLDKLASGALFDKFASGMARGHRR